MNRAWKSDIYKGINNAEQQERTKSDAALMIPIAKFIQKYIF